MFIGPPKISGPPLNLTPPKIYFFPQVPTNYFGLKSLGPPLKLGGAATMDTACFSKNNLVTIK